HLFLSSHGSLVYSMGLGQPGYLFLPVFHGCPAALVQWATTFTLTPAACNAVESLSSGMPSVIRRLMSLKSQTLIRAVLPNFELSEIIMRFSPRDSTMRANSASAR